MASSSLPSASIGQSTDGRTVESRASGTERNRLPGSSGGQLKAGLKAAHKPLREVVASAVELAMQQKEAAYLIGRSEGRLSSKLKDGSLTVRQLEALGVVFGRRLGEECKREYGTDDPVERMRLALADAKRKLEEAQEAIGQR